MKAKISESERGRAASAYVFIALAAIAMSEMLALPAQATDETVIHNFAGAPDGNRPVFNLIQDTGGNLYGVTAQGGIYDQGHSYYSGTVFELSPQNGAWAEQILYSFSSSSGGDPNGTLVLDKSGNLYGVASMAPCCRGLTMVYELTPDGKGNWTQTILHVFGFGYRSPVGGLALDAAGNLYGVSEEGGGHSCLYGCGFVYELSPPAKNAKKKKWTYATLYSFLGPKYGDGGYPNGDLILDAAGDLYGTTQWGGAHGKDWYGNVFELSPGAGGWTEKVLYNFGGSPSDGALPYAGVVFDAAGNLYGTTLGGGSGGWGTVFELTPDAGSWAETTVYSFTGQNDGGYPGAPVTLHNGSLYSTTALGGNQPGNSGSGVVFELSPSGSNWTEKVLYTFAGPPNDGPPSLGSGVIVDNAGILYGLAEGGTDGYGFVYEISH